MAVMKQPARKQRGVAGQTAVRGFFEQIGSGPLETGEHDLGTDLFVQLRDRDLSDLGLVLGVQVKTGASWFNEPVEQDGEPGWWFRDSLDHGEYWQSHHVAHIVVLVSEDLQYRYWAPLLAPGLQPTGKGVRVFVPARNTLSPDQLGNWIEIALSRQADFALHGSSWDFRVTRVAEASWARYALLAPRLVAPHPNRSPATWGPINWAEAAALSVRAELRRWDQFAGDFDDVPSLEQARTHTHPGWRFAALVRDWMTGALPPDWDVPEIDFARPEAVGLSVVGAMVCWGRDQRGTAERTLAAIAASELSPEDRGWVDLLRARIGLECGVLEDAIRLLGDAGASLGRVRRRDVTVDVVRSAVLSAQFGLALDGGLFAAVVRGADNPSSWWSSQKVASALEAATKEQFEAWAGHPGRTLWMEDQPHNGLVSAGAVAQLSGAWDRWRGLQQLLGRIDLILGRIAPDDALHTLRQAGDKDDLTLAIRRLLRFGPLDALRAFAETLTPESTTRSRVLSDLAAVAEVAEVMEADLLQRWIAAVLDALADGGILPTSRDHQLTRPSLEALRRLADDMDDGQRCRLLDIVLELAPSTDEVTFAACERVVEACETPESLRVSLARRWAETEPQSRPWRLLMLASRDDPVVRDRAGEMLVSGDLSGFAGVQYWRDLRPAEVTGVLAGLKAEIESQRPQEGPGGQVTRAMSAHQSGRRLAHLALWALPDDEVWDALASFLADAGMPLDTKLPACEELAQQPRLIPHGARQGLFLAVDAIVRGGSRAVDPLPFTLNRTDPSAPEELWLELHPDHDVANAAATEMLADPSRRSGCVRFMGRRPGWEQVLLALLGDRDFEVSRRATAALTQRVLAEPSCPPMWQDALVGVLQRDGIGYARSFLEEVSDVAPSEINEAGRELLSALKAHPVRFVRDFARSVLSSPIGGQGAVQGDRT